MDIYIYKCGWVWIRIGEIYGFNLYIYIYICRSGVYNVSKVQICFEVPVKCLYFVGYLDLGLFSFEAGILWIYIYIYMTLYDDLWEIIRGDINETMVIDWSYSWPRPTSMGILGGISKWGCMTWEWGHKSYYVCMHFGVRGYPGIFKTQQNMKLTINKMGITAYERRNWNIIFKWQQLEMVLIMVKK